MKTVAKLILAAAAVAAVAGCEPPGKVSRIMPPPVALVDRLGVHVERGAAINWDDEPGPDGVFVRVYCYQYHQPKTVTINGVLEFMVFEGRLTTSTIDNAQALKVWKFTADELPACAVRSTVGWGYAMQLGWDKDVPKTRRITLVARFISPTGAETFSVPVSIPVSG
jgi:hypothetical protein